MHHSPRRGPPTLLIPTVLHRTRNHRRPRNATPAPQSPIFTYNPQVMGDQNERSGAISNLRMFDALVDRSAVWPKLSGTEPTTIISRLNGIIDIVSGVCNWIFYMVEHPRSVLLSQEGWPPLILLTFDLNRLKINSPGSRLVKADQLAVLRLPEPCHPTLLDPIQSPTRNIPVFGHSAVTAQSAFKALSQLAALRFEQSSELISRRF
ncbi:hypothetical protein R3P38DRAFT_3589892 [Favolaschia claudopus]|uniref:Uncharacterized protein n=1 Tax=Favolaschia claudopus TaxID=2862362 RepID=A0AAW0AHS0_9AGAR